MDQARRFALFRVLAIVEIAAVVGCIVTSFQSGPGGGALGILLVMILFWSYVAGCVVAVLGVIAKPRQPLMIVSLVVHALIGALMLSTPTIDRWISKRRQEEYRRMREEEERQQQ